MRSSLESGNYFFISIWIFNKYSGFVLAIKKSYYYLNLMPGTVLPIFSYHSSKKNLSEFIIFIQYYYVNLKKSSDGFFEYYS